MKVYSGYPGGWLVPLDRVGVICYGTETTSDVGRETTVGKKGVHGPYRAHPSATSSPASPPAMESDEVLA
jgi:hypothetical protein